MTDLLERLAQQRLWDFPGGVHPPEMKAQSNTRPLTRLAEPEKYYIPLKQHAGNSGVLLVKVGDKVQKGQALTQGNNYRTLPVHAPTSGTVIAIEDYPAAHPSGMAETTLVLQADGLDQWRPQQKIDDFLAVSPEQLIEKIYLAGVAGLGGAVFPTAEKLSHSDKKIKLLIINGAECEPYITCDDRLMRDCSKEIIEGIRILRYILRPEKVIIAIEDNKPEAIKAINRALKGANDIDVRVIPTKYPSGAAKQLIQILTGLEVPKGQHASSLGILMQNVGTAFAVKRAVIDDEPLIERVVTLTGDKIPAPRNLWVRLGTPVYHLLQQAGYQYDTRFPVFMGGPMMGFILPNLNAPVTKATNCLIAPDHFEYMPPPPERNCIRCSACSDHCPVQLLPQQLYWFARSEDHEKSEQYSLRDCIECGVCAYVCPSNIPLIQYFRQEKAKIAEIKLKAKLAEEAKQRFEARQARLEKEKQAREKRTQLAAAARREEIAKQQGEDPVQAALARIKAKQAASTVEATASAGKTQVNDKGELLPDNSEIMAQRKARRLQRQNSNVSQITQQDNSTSNDIEDKKSAIAAAVARAKAKKAALQNATANAATSEQLEKSAGENATVSANAVQTPVQTAMQPLAQTEKQDPRKAAIAAAVARAKAKKAALQNATASAATSEQLEKSAGENATVSANAVQTPVQTAMQPLAQTETQDPRKAAIAAAVARAKAKKAAQQNATANAATSEQLEKSAGENATVSTNVAQTPVQTAMQPLAQTETQDPRKAAIAAAVARAKAKKAAQQNATASTAASEQLEKSAGENATVSANAVQPVVQTATQPLAQTETQDPRKAAIAVARAKAKKAARQANNSENTFE